MLCPAHFILPTALGKRDSCALFRFKANLGLREVITCSGHTAESVSPQSGHILPPILPFHSPTHFPRCSWTSILTGPHRTYCTERCLEEKPEAGLNVEDPSARGRERAAGEKEKGGSGNAMAGNPGQVSEITRKIKVNNNKNKRPLKHL